MSTKKKKKLAAGIIRIVPCVRLPAYDAEVHAFLGMPRVEANAIAHHLFGIPEIFREEAKGMAACFGKDRKNFACIWIQGFPKRLRPEPLSTLVHEASHAMLMILGAIRQGVDVEKLDHEHYTYHVHYIFREILEQYLK